MAFRRRKQNDGKYLRLTGLWMSKKKDSLFSGKMRSEDIEKLVEKAAEAQDSNSDLLFFLWENDKESKKDPDFTLQVTVAEAEAGSSRRSGRGRSDRDEDRDEERGRKRDTVADDETEDADDDVEEEKPRRGSAGRKNEVKAKKDNKDDW